MNRWLYPPSLEQASWAKIKEVSDAGLASQYWNVGDMKKIVLNGTVGMINFNNFETYVYIIGIDHNKKIEGTGITFGCFKTKDGVDIALVDSNYNNSKGSEDGTKYFNMNHGGMSNKYGWKGCDVRYDVLGSTNKKNGYATATTATNPVANTLMAALPSDLRAVMKPIIIYTKNGVEISNSETEVTDSTDYLPLLGEYEIFGTRTYANSAEKNYQKQYAYYSAGNSKVKYRHDNTSSTAIYSVRSPRWNNNYAFCVVNTDGNVGAGDADVPYALAPIFRV